MTDDEILAGIQTIAREHLDHDAPLSLSQRLVEDLELDSIRMLTLAVEVEDRFRVILPEDLGAELRTVGDLVGLVRSARCG